MHNETFFPQDSFQRAFFFLFLKLNLEGYVLREAALTQLYMVALPLTSWGNHGGLAGAPPSHPGGFTSTACPVPLQCDFNHWARKSISSLQDTGDLGALTMAGRQTDLSSHQERLRVPGELSSGEDSLCFSNTLCSEMNKLS